ncbi:hypothetical protein B0181_01345 [Moraxella caviae]|uniref:Uncharacterized protein n=1 Tax=Moraxella caviae TaxID=34060 RepID=A0A1T0AAQ7_9GAMM|nr:hypothetical protein B0181_01345 [Moraxella caviae]
MNSIQTNQAPKNTKFGTFWLILPNLWRILYQIRTNCANYNLCPSNLARQKSAQPNFAVANSTAVNSVFIKNA